MPYYTNAEQVGDTYNAIVTSIDSTLWKTEGYESEEVALAAAKNIADGWNIRDFVILCELLNQSVPLEYQPIEEPIKKLIE